jgi:hypothetical protein
MARFGKLDIGVTMAIDDAAAMRVWLIRLQDNGPRLATTMRPAAAVFRLGLLRKSWIYNQRGTDSAGGCSIRGKHRELYGEA